MRSQPNESSSKRQLVYVPAVNPRSFLLFYQKGEKKTAWSLRDYSQRGRVEVRYAEDFGWDAAEVRRMSAYSFDAPAVSTTNLDFWHEETIAKNSLYCLARAVTLRCDGDGPGKSVQYPLLAEDELLGLPKANKRGDMKRFRTSPNSEDWVTWNFLHLLQTSRPRDWWRSLDDAAQRSNASARLGLRAEDEPRLEYWRKVRAPREYERLSRKRMEDSGRPKLAKRAASSSPVEGESEIDVIFESRRHLVFLEAKLGSDVSARTTYDPARNQIARNIDCLLDTAGGKEPYFWMLVRDSRVDRMYVQLTAQYRSEPGLLRRDLPHRSEAVLHRVAERIAIIRWRDLGNGWIDQPLDDPIAEAVRLELVRRICKD